jgi:probable addiction module antidote protein
VSEKIRAADLPNFDITEMLKTDEDIAEYLTVVIEDGDPAMLAVTLGDIARARGMTQIARDSGITREALYRALRPGATPRFDTVARVCKALGVRLVAQVAPVEAGTATEQALATGQATRD